MPNTQGLVSEIRTRDTSYGTMYNFVVNGEEFGAGKFPPRGVAAGDDIEFSFEDKGRYKNLDSKSVKKVGAPSAAQVATSTAATAVASSSASAKDATISKQAARNTAVAFMTLLGSVDALPVAASAKPAAKFEVLRGVLDKLTQEFFDFSMGKTTSTPLTDAAEDVGGSDGDPADGPWTN